MAAVRVVLRLSSSESTDLKLTLEKSFDRSTTGVEAEALVKVDLTGSGSVAGCDACAGLSGLSGLPSVPSRNSQLR